MSDHFTHCYLDEQSRAVLRDMRGDLWIISLNTEFGPEVTLAERGVPESQMSTNELRDESLWRDNAVRAKMLTAADEIDRLRTALVPFAELGSRLAGNNHEAAPVKQCFFRSPGIDAINAGHLKAAVAALTS